MAVEIPVVIDIDGAFAAAAAKMPKAMQPLERSIEKLNSDLAVFRDVLREADIDSLDFKTAAKEMQNISQAIEVANDKFLKFSTNEGSIRRMSGELASLNRRWEEMGAAQKFRADGSLTADAQKLKAEYKAITEEIKRSGQTLAQLEAEERRLLSLKQKGQQQRKYENAILNATVKSMRVLQEQERILSARLQTTQVGTTKFKDLATKLAEVRKEMSLVEAQVRRGGAAYRDLGANASRSTSQIKATTAALSTQGGVLKRLAGYLSGYTLLFTGIRFVHNVRQTTAELELQRVALGGILNDTEKATELFRQIKAAALRSPFEIKDLVTYTKQLSAYQIETDKLFTTMTRLADVSAGLGVDMNRLILAYGQVRAASVLRGQELRQFTEAGIPLVDKLAKKFQELGREGTTTADVFDLISKRAVPFSMIEEIFEDMTKAGGIFYNMQEKQSETLKGQWMKLRDAVTIMYDEIGNTKGMHDAMTTLIQTANNLARSWKSVAVIIKTLIPMIVTYNMVSKASIAATNAVTAAEARRLAVSKAQAIAMPKFIAAIIGETKAKVASRIVTRQLEIAQYKLATATTVAERAMWKLWAAIIKNPYALAAAAVIGLVASIGTMINRSREAVITIEQLDQSISRFEKSLTKARDADRLINIYEELSKKSDKTAEETEQLERVTNELARTFPSAVSGINNETNALDINLKKVKELTKAEQELELARLRGDRRNAEAEVERLEKEKNKILEEYKAGGRFVYGVATGKGYDPSKSSFMPLNENDLERMGKRLGEINEKLEPIYKDLERISELEQGLGLEDPTKDSRTKTAFKGWKQVLSKIQEEKIKAGAPQIFTPQDIESLGSVHDLWKAVKKGIKETTTELNGLKSIQKGLSDDAAKSNELATKLTEKELELYNAIKAAFGFVFGKEGGGSYQQDPFIQQIKDRIKFMQDFKKGYDDLNKYMSSSEAKEKESSIMQGRGLSLGLDAEQQIRSIQDLSGWYEDMIEEVQEKLKKRGVKGSSVTDFLGIDTTKKSKAIQDLQKLLQSLWDAKTDFDTSQKKKDIEDAMKRLSDEIKRSETARNFYQNILDLTGDQEMASTMTVSVYGDVGKEFKDRLQNSLESALAHFDDGGNLNLWKKMNDAVMEGDFDTIMKYIDRFPVEWQKRLKEMSEMDQKHNAELASNLLKSLQSAKSYSEKRVEISRKAAQRIADINAMEISESQKESLRKQSAKKEAEEAAKLAYEAFKDTPMYIELFADLDRASSTMLKSMRDNLSSMKKEWKEDLAPTELRELQSRLNEIDKQLAVKNPFRALIDSIKEYRELSKNGDREEADAAAVGLTDYANLQKSLLDLATERYNEAVRLHGINSEEAYLAKDELDTQKELTDSAIEQADAAQNIANGFRLAAKHLADAGEALQEWAGYVQTSLSGIGDIVETFSSEKTASIFNTLSEGINKTIGGTAKIASGAAMGLAGIPTIISGIGDAVSGVFGTISKLKIEAINKKIEKQQELIEDLEYSYGRLENAIAKAFGSDYIYNYNQQLENLLAKQAAYEEQARLESEKGKKKDEEKIKEYKNAARDAQDQILEMKGQLSEFFTDMDLTSAAEDFASAWIDAYKEFGSTTDAMKEKFNDMIQSMIQKSLGAKIMQTILQPLFEEIDKMANDGALTADEIAQIGAEAPTYIAQMNDAMTTLMNQIGAAGYNMRQQVGGFTGISRNIAGATEESINGLAAGINTQNFYISHIDNNVASILAALTGGASIATPASGALLAEEVDPFKDTMLSYASAIPVMRDDMSAIRSMLDKVVKPAGVKATHYVATNA